MGWIKDEFFRSMRDGDLGSFFVFFGYMSWLLGDRG